MITTKRQKMKGFRKISPIFHSKVDAQKFLDNVERKRDCRPFFRIVEVPKVYPFEYYVIAKYEEL